MILNVVDLKHGIDLLRRDPNSEGNVGIDVQNGILVIKENIN